MNIARIGVGLQGFYKIEAVRPDGRRRLLADWFPNIITNLGLNRLGTSFPVDRAMVGTGTSTPTATQTQLDNRIATTASPGAGNATAGNFNTGPETDHYGWRRWVFRFNTGVATGNLTEVGVGWGDTSLFSRALILDGGGSPTTITVLPDESLDVTYELRLYATTTDVTGNFVISGTTYSTVLRPSDFPSGWGNPGYASEGVMGGSPMGVSHGAGALGAISASPGGSTTGNSSSAVAIGSYVNNSYERDIRYTWGLNNGNADISNVLLRHGLGRHKISFSPVLAKRDTNVLTLDLRVTWARRT